MKAPSEMTTTQLVLAIRQIESSPSAHRSWQIQKMVDENLAALRAELDRRQS